MKTVKNLDDTKVRSHRPLGTKAAKHERSRGQILILFVMAIFVFVGMVALVIDVSWYWVNSLRVQRAADAAALAGVVQLPTNPTAANGAFALARAESKKNGYEDLVGGVSVSPVQDPPVTGRRLVVTVSAPVPTFFMRIFGLNSITATRVSRAEFVLPVPMGSPDNWYGVFGPTRGLTSTSTAAAYYTRNIAGNSGFKVATQSFSPAPVTPAWTVTGGTLVTAANAQDTTYAQTNTDQNNQLWGNFNLLSGLAGNETATNVTGLQVRLTDVHVSAACANTTIQVALSYDGNIATPHWTSNVAGPLPAGNITPALGTSVTAGDYTFGNAANLTAWPLSGPGHTWMGNDLGNGTFRVRLTANKGCGTGAQIRVDQIQVQANFLYDRLNPPVTSTVTLPDVDLKGPGAPCTTGKVNCFESTGQLLHDVSGNPNGFWGTMNTEGAENVNGDAYQAYYDDLSPVVNNPAYNASDFYNYAVEMPPGSSGGSVYVYDPVFCATDHAKGTGDRWFGNPNQVSSFYELYDTQGTVQDIGDDGPAIADSLGTFGGTIAEDVSMGGTHSGTSTPLDCKYATDSLYNDARDYHNRWYLLASGLTGGTNGKVYRVHTTSTDKNNVGASRGTYGENSFALYTKATVGTPRIYGIGAMQAFTPLSSNSTTTETASEFYLAQIDAVHAGKTVEIKLWDPGDTNPLIGRLQILVPTTSGWTPTLFDYTAAQGTTNGNVAACNTLTGNDVSSVQTSTPASRFNGCWLTIQIPIPSGYTAPQSGWWKIGYRMKNSGGGTDTSDDVTTWKVAIRGNPVHLVVP